MIIILFRVSYFRLFSDSCNILYVCFYLDKVENVCTSLIMCILTTLKSGFKNDGGIGDSLRVPSIDEPIYMFRILYDLAFFFIVVVLILNLILGIIIDTFVDLRTTKRNRKALLLNTCFICGKFNSLNRSIGSIDSSHSVPA